MNDIQSLTPLQRMTRAHELLMSCLTPTPLVHGAVEGYVRNSVQCLGFAIHEATDKPSPQPKGISKPPYVYD